MPCVCWRCKRPTGIPEHASTLTQIPRRWSDLLDEAARRRKDDRIARRLLGLDNTAGWLTLREAIQETNDILAETDLPHIRDIDIHFNGVSPRRCG
jgi:hypothetical protein